MTQLGKATGSAERPLNARQRARAARARTLEAQRLREKRIQDALTVAFEELGAAEAARLAMAAAEQRLAAALADVRELGEKPQDLAEAMELPVAEIHRLLKLAEESQAGDGVGAEAIGTAS